MSDKTTSYKGYQGSIDVSLEDNCLHGRLLFINDIITYEGETPSALIQSFREAVDGYLEYCERTGKPANKTLGGTFNVRIGEERHRILASRTAEAGIAINEGVCAAIDSWIAVPKIAPTHNHFVNIYMEGPQKTQLLTSQPGAVVFYPSEDSSCLGDQNVRH